MQGDWPAKIPEDFAPDFEKLGFKCGLEIHQQLLTESKLFCRCKARLRRDPPSSEILRHMRPTLSEMGTYDGTALMEFKTKKNVIYQLYSDSVCTYEMDDTPPFALNQQALDIGLEIALSLGCSIVDEVHVSRKQYLDGSIPTGFQRTAILGVDGSVPFKDGRTIGIIQLGLEEDACREMSDKGHVVVFKTDRLSIPLVEVVTRPDLKSPKEVAEGAEHLGRLMRATGKVRRGMGATRQDVNVSVNGSTRIEIKGVPKLQWLEALTGNEAIRQQSLLVIRDILRSRGVTEGTIHTEVKDLGAIFAETKCPQIAAALRTGGIVKGILLSGFGGLLGRDVMYGVRFADEFAGRVKVIACLDAPVNLIFTEDMPAHGTTEAERKAVEAALRSRHSDVVVIVWGLAEDVETAMKEIRLRALDAIAGVPSETRQAFANGTTGFERILPGPDRMYPDTDSPPIPLTEERVERLRKGLVEPPWSRQARYAKMGIPAHDARELSISRWAGSFDALVNAGHPAKATAFFIAEKMKSLRRSGVDTGSVSDAVLREAFDFVKGAGMSYNVLPRIVAEMARGKRAAEAARRAGLAAVEDGELSGAAGHVADYKHGKKSDISLLMEHFKGAVSAERARKALGK